MVSVSVVVRVGCTVRTRVSVLSQPQTVARWWVYVLARVYVVPQKVTELSAQMVSRVVLLNVGCTVRWRKTLLSVPLERCSEVLMVPALSKVIPSQVWGSTLSQTVS